MKIQYRRMCQASWIAILLMLCGLKCVSAQSNSAKPSGIDPRAVVTKADVEAVMGQKVDLPTLQNKSTCIYRMLPQHYNVEVSVIDDSAPDRFRSLREISGKRAAIQLVEGLGDEAYWVPDNYRLSVRKGAVELHITTVLPVKEQTKAGQDAARVQRKDAAIKLARNAFERIAKGESTYQAPKVADAPAKSPPPDADTIAKLIEQLSSPGVPARIDAVNRLSKLQSPPPNVIAALTKAVSDKDQVVSFLAVSALAMMGPSAKESVPALVEIAKSETVAARRRGGALYALAKIGEQPDIVVPLILAAMKRRDPEELVTALAAAGEFKSQGPQFIAPLLELVRGKADEQLEVNRIRVACETLAQLARDGASKAVPALIEELLSIHAVIDTELAKASAVSAAEVPNVLKPNIGPRFKVDRISNALLRIHNSMNDKSPAVVPTLTALSRQAQGLRLSNIGGVDQKSHEIVEDALQSLKHEHPVVRQGAAWTLGDRPAAARPHLARLVELFEDKEPLVRLAAAESTLAIEPSNDGAAQLIVLLLNESDARLRLAATHSIIALHQVPQATAKLARGAVPRLVAMLKGDLASERSKAMTAVLMIGESAADVGPELGEVVCDKATNGSMSERRMAVLALGRLGPKAIVPLVKLLSHPNARQRERAAQILAGVIAGERPYLGHDSANIQKFKRENTAILRLPGDEGVRVLIAATKDTDERVRWRSAIALGEIGPKAATAIPSLVEMLKEQTTFVRWDAAWAINEIDSSVSVEARRKATADQPTVLSEKGDRLTLLRIDPPLPAKLAAGESLEVRLAYSVKSADERAVAASAWHGDRRARYGHDGLMHCRRGEGEIVDHLSAEEPVDRLRFLFGDRSVSPAKFEFELVINGKAEWEALPAKLNN